MPEPIRNTNLGRLSSPKTSPKDPIFLHHKYLFADIEWAVKTYAKGKVLDIGCGNKPYKTFFDNAASEYIGCDVVQSSLNLVDIICSCTDIPVEDNSIDTVFSTQVMEHVAEHEKMLSEAFRVLKENGVIILTVPMCWEHHEEPYDFFRFTKYGLDFLFRKVKFTPILIKPNGGKWALAGQVLLNNIRSTIERPVKPFKIKVVSSLYRIFGIKYCINYFFSFLDRIDTDDKISLNYLVIASKTNNT